MHGPLANYRSLMRIIYLGYSQVYLVSRSQTTFSAGRYRLQYKCPHFLVRALILQAITLSDKKWSGYARL